MLKPEMAHQLARESSFPAEASLVPRLRVGQLPSSSADVSAVLRSSDATGGARAAHRGIQVAGPGP